ncbi:hypothetical protein CVT24_008182 [Panaeolus cyanescens]|uniref:Uncharacterized protein n=1 Tax=Panaeolus cyanescens TaxID=181874 RepID=A0A409VFL1_9AGAR|nr:hypothetical protein CVT24_008182 [Panaeolus cyanescens]
MATTLHIDDRDSSVTYSRPASGGHWSNQASRESDAFQSTLKLTRTVNARATVRFRGTSITVVGVIEDSGSSPIAPSSSYQIDDGAVKVYTGVITNRDQYHIEFFKSDPLPMGEHTLVITNLAELSYLWLDEFIITQGPEPIPNSPSPSPTIINSDPSSPAPSRIQTTPTSVQANRNPTSISSSPSTSATSTSGSNQGSSSNTPVPIISTSSTLTNTPVPSLDPGVDTNAGPGSADSNIAGGVFLGSAKEQAPVPVGAIIGGVLGALALILAIVLVLMWWRQLARKKKEGTTNYNQIDGFGRIPWDNSPQQQISPSDISRPSVSEVHKRRPSTDGSDNSGAGRVQAWAATQGAAPVGKRQYVATDDNATFPETRFDRLPSYHPNGRLRTGERLLDTGYSNTRQKM